jgi:hypothetical protein
MTNSLQGQTKGDKQFQIRSDLNLVTISLQTHTKTPSKLIPKLPPTYILSEDKGTKLHYTLYLIQKEPN